MTALPLVLASRSPRRRALLREVGFAFRVVAPDVDETPPPGPAAAACAAIARRKAEAAVARLRRPAVVLAADTLVVVRGSLVGKPRGRSEARTILRRLSGTTHQVVTGVCVARAGATRPSFRTFAATTRVTMRRWSKAEIEAYLDSGEWRGKAGAYAIQESADRFVTRVAGSWSNVVGLPMERVVTALARFRVRPARSRRFPPRRRTRGRGSDRGAAAPRGADRGRRRSRSRRPRSGAGSPSE